MRTKNFNPQCSCCGKFIGYREFEQNSININFTPDTHLTVEKIEYEHKECN